MFESQTDLVEPIDEAMAVEFIDMEFGEESDTVGYGAILQIDLEKVTRLSIQPGDHSENELTVKFDR